jgi:hypothetical protein
MHVKYLKVRSFSKLNIFTIKCEISENKLPSQGNALIGVFQESVPSRIIRLERENGRGGWETIA